MKAIFTILIIISGWWVIGQQLISASTQSEIKILGTSSVHDWHSTVEQFEFTATLDQDTLKDVNGRIKVKSIKSGKSIMDGKTYDALLAEEFPNIVFSASYFSLQGDQFVGEGRLSLAGNQNTMPIILKIEKKEPLTVKGEVSFLMTAFGIDPPTAMFGTLTTGDEITIQFSITMTKSSIKQ